MPLSEQFTDLYKNSQKSYMMILMLSFLNKMDPRSGIAKLTAVESEFLDQLVRRESKGLPVDTPPKPYHSWSEISPSALRSIFMQPVKTKAMEKVLESVKQADGDYLRFNPYLTRQLDETGLQEIREAALRELKKYHNEPLEDRSLQQEFLTIMNHYTVVKEQPIKDHWMAKLVRHTIPNFFENLPFLTDNYRIQGSVGRSDNWVKNPWIAFMDKRVTETTRMGYYVCYLFSEDMSAMYLCFKHSDESHRFKGRDGVQLYKETVETIRKKLPSHRFTTDDIVDWGDKKNNLNYLAGVMVHKKYERVDLPPDEILLQDLQDMLSLYKGYVDMNTSVSTVTLNDQEVVKHIEHYIEAKGFHYPKHLLENFYLCLRAKPFVILAGISGTGKTKLAELFAEAIGAQFKLIPVRPDWSDPSDLIGYRNLQGKFQPGEITKVLVEATQPENRETPYFICLDEMNLARVEHYFSDMLSIFETRKFQDEEIVTQNLISTAGLDLDDTELYGALNIPQNVYFIGTVNMDETTHPFSKKVLDRANTIEFNHVNLKNWSDNESTAESAQQTVTPLRAPNSILSCDFLTLKDAISEHKGLIDATTTELIQINTILETIHAHVGFRVRDELCFYMIYNDRIGLLERDTAFDHQLCQKILPRLQGSSLSIKRVLLQLYKHTTNQSGLRVEEYLHDASKLYNEIPINARYPLSTKKIAYMLRRFEEDGFTSFWLS